MSLLAGNDDAPAPETLDPFVLLDRAGYDAFHADTLEKQNSIERYFKPGELLCTFNDAARYQNYHIVHAVKKDADQIRRADFNGQEKRQDAYGTSVISIQMLKRGGFISIKNRYNHAVQGCDNTFDSNPDNIIDGLSAALKDHFKVEFSAGKNALPEGFVLMGGRIFKYHAEFNNIYYGDQTWAQNGAVHAVDRGAGDALFDSYLFDNKTKTLRHVDPDRADSFPGDFNRDYGGRRGLAVQDGNLVLDGETLIGAEGSRIKTLSLPALTAMGDGCLIEAQVLTTFDAPALATMGARCLYEARALTTFSAPALATMDDACLFETHALTIFEAPALTAMGAFCLVEAHALTTFSTPALATMGKGCFDHARALTTFSTPALTAMGNECLVEAPALTTFHAPALTAMGTGCLYAAHALTSFSAPALATMSDRCLYHAHALTSFSVPALTAMGDCCLYHAHALTSFHAPALTTVPPRLQHLARASGAAKTSGPPAARGHAKKIR
jgi:hypothetical protein